ncbi:MAG: hypothetical protein V3T42_03490 [Nitrospirales bacterium]
MSQRLAQGEELIDARVWSVIEDQVFFPDRKTYDMKAAWGRVRVVARDG